jgi:hypothetical protein
LPEDIPGKDTVVYEKDLTSAEPHPGFRIAEVVWRLEVSK